MPPKKRSTKSAPPPSVRDAPKLSSAAKIRVATCAMPVYRVVTDAMGTAAQLTTFDNISANLGKAGSAQYYYNQATPGIPPLWSDDDLRAFYLRAVHPERVFYALTVVDAQSTHAAPNNRALHPDIMQIEFLATWLRDSHPDTASQLDAGELVPAPPLDSAVCDWVAMTPIITDQLMRFDPDNHRNVGTTRTAGRWLYVSALPAVEAEHAVASSKAVTTDTETETETETASTPPPPLSDTAAYDLIRLIDLLAIFN